MVWSGHTADVEVGSEEVGGGDEEAGMELMQRWSRGDQKVVRRLAVCRQCGGRVEVV